MSQVAALRDVLTVILLACGTATVQWVRYAPVVALLPVGRGGGLGFRV